MEFERPLRQTNVSDGLLFKSESLLEDKKWEEPAEDKAHASHSRRSSNGGFFHGETKGKEGTKGQ